MRVKRGMQAALAAAALIGGVYGLTVIGVSLLSHETVLAPGEEQSLCGLVSGCDRVVSLLDVTRLDTIGDVHADGTYYVVTVAFRNAGRGGPTRFTPLTVRVIDGAGRRYRPRRVAEDALSERGVETGPPRDPVLPGRTVEARFVFDLPPGVRAPRLAISDADPLTRVGAFVRLGSDESFLHAPTTFAIETAALASRVAHGTQPVCTALGRCPAAVRLANVSIDTSAGVGVHAVPADGMFWVVTLHVRARGSLGIPQLDAAVVDATGRRYDRARDVEALLPTPPASVVRYVFDLPGDVAAPRLVLREPGLLNALFGRPARLTLPVARDRA